MGEKELKECEASSLSEIITVSRRVQLSRTYLEYLHLCYSLYLQHHSPIGEQIQILNILQLP